MVRDTVESLLNDIDDTLDEFENRFDYDGNSTILMDCYTNEKLSENVIVKTTPVLRTSTSFNKFRTGSRQIFSQFSKNFVWASAR